MVLADALAPHEHKPRLLGDPTTEAARRAKWSTHEPSAALKLRAHPVVAVQLERWWQTAEDTVEGVVLSHKDYVRIWTLIAHALLGGSLNEASAIESAWTRATAGGRTLVSAAFLDGIFDLADIHLPSTTAHDYASFLSSLHDQVAHSPHGDTKWYWRSDTASVPASPTSPLAAPPSARPATAPMPTLAPMAPAPGVPSPLSTPTTSSAPRSRFMRPTRACTNRSARRGADSKWLHDAIGVPPPTPRPPLIDAPAPGGSTRAGAFKLQLDSTPLFGPTTHGRAWTYVEAEGVRAAEGGLRRPAVLRATVRWHVTWPATWPAPGREATVMVNAWGGAMSASPRHAGPRHYIAPVVPRLPPLVLERQLAGRGW